MTRETVISAVVLSALIGGGIFVYMYYDQGGAPGADNDTAQAVEYEPPTNDIAPRGLHTYFNRTYGLSLQYPEDLRVAERAEAAGGSTITFEDDEGKQGFQIYIAPYDDGQIDKSRIDLDTHGSAEAPPTEVVLQNGAHALVFFSRDQILGRLREVWFIRDRRLYEVTAYAELDAWLSSIMQTLKFSQL